jgi:hypothetical protein
MSTAVSILGIGMLILLLPREMHDPAVRWGLAGVFGVVLGGYAALRMDRLVTRKATPQPLTAGSESTAKGKRSVAARDISGKVITGNTTEQFNTSLQSAISALSSSKLKHPEDPSAPTRSIATGERSVAARDICGDVATGDMNDGQHP